MNNKNQKLFDNLKKNDVVIFRNLFSMQTGRVSEVIKNQEGKIIFYRVKCIDATSMISTYETSPDEVFEVVDENNQLSQKKIQEGSYILFSHAGKTLTGRIDNVLDNQYTVMSVNRDFTIDKFTITNDNIIQLIRL
ncbi:MULTISPECIES: hypothetical protein [unclassified Gilliamella]|uniref:hypothetical protein n=1 Tax=unclassified Gilliamella TaxID=2685620 RepID=UPI00226A5511|nr:MULTISPECIES: hypothetical protein [unclassified Gilliamella]MCX8589124.1 hypothetical protein [Gilliamella sp. B3801]MCX8592605.1 hypothetical protein [Gilliamella sp. B3804]